MSLEGGDRFAALHAAGVSRAHVPLCQPVIFSYDAIRDEPSSFTIQFSFLTVVDFRFLTVELRKLPWREYIRRDNPVAAALVSKMGDDESERVAAVSLFRPLRVLH
ncbi:Transposase [Geobacillus thermoleovorans CCB_US3_UF5]|uniref:Transposase n=2 Tax=Geobacillus TaxID=129337 RepID=A0A0B5KQL1_9BACL|nr:Transposase [Geobacillus thermoleovorans CCB_US3_UF5]AJG38054.1 transposase [Geobacillus sp. enrichment culture clone fosmid MGS-MG1]EQB94324.1 hypothetical protein GA8_17610 [Geobacillus sp. A8]GAJ57351.1 hypothetical protein B23_0540 [Geobacillus thermoleovorans B23]